jgi:hypothetical protein
VCPESCFAAESAGAAVMTSILTRAIRYGLIDELDELYEALADWVIARENNAATSGFIETVDAELVAEERLTTAFGVVEGAVAIYDTKGGHEHGRAGEHEGKAGLR